MAFVKGQSGNPSGRPKTDNVAARLAKEHGVKAIERLAALLDSGDERVVHSAAVALLDRGYGKPTQPIAGDDDFPPVTVQAIERTIVDPKT